MQATYPVEVNLYVYNLLDEEYYFSATGPFNSWKVGPGITLYSKISVAF